MFCWDVTLRDRVARKALFVFKTESMRCLCLIFVEVNVLSIPYARCKAEIAEITSSNPFVTGATIICVSQKWAAAMHALL